MLIADCFDAELCPYHSRTFHKVKSGQIQSNPVKSGQIQSNPVKSGQIQSNPVKSGQIRSKSDGKC